jgi:cell division protein FtsL
MPHGPEHHLDEAEHAQHSAHNPFDRRVTLTMAIVAALLACVTMLSHRAHNLTLQNQIKSNDHITERANVFAHYQAKKNRQLMDEAFADSLEIHVINSNSATKEKAEKTLTKWRNNVKKWKADAKTLEEKGKKLARNIRSYADAAHIYHHRADFFDYGELGVELSLILCSIALLTKSRGFWLAGLAAAALGCGVALCVFLIPPSPEAHAEEEEVAALAPQRPSGTGSGGTPASTDLDERVNAQRQKDGTQQRHRRQTDAANPLDLAFAHQTGNQPGAGGQEAEEAEHGGGVHGMLE